MKKYLIWALRIIAAIILLQTLFFKFTAAPESQFIFSSLGVEPWGRILSGIIELVAGVMLLIPATQIVGAILSLNVMVGAILSHVFILGIEIQNDGGLLFMLALIVFVSNVLTLTLQWQITKDFFFKLKK